VLGALVPRPISTASITPAAVFRTIEKYRPVFLIDEADTAVAKNEELRALINAGHTRTSAFVVRTVGDEHEPRLFSTWCPKAIALIGRLPDTTEDRAIVIAMRRKTKDEKVERLRGDRLEGETVTLQRMACRWGRDHLDELRDADPDMPEELDDRAQDSWRPLLAIADVAGGAWPDRARKAARMLSGAAEKDEGSARILVLTDIRELFAEHSVDRLPSSEIVDALVKLEDRPWPEWRHGQPLSTAALAKLLKPFGIRPKPMDWRGAHPKGTRGYALEDMTDAFDRYCTPPAEPQPPQPSNSGAGFDGFSNRNLGGQGCTLENAENPHGDYKVAEVALREGGIEAIADSSGGARGAGIGSRTTEPDANRDAPVPLELVAEYPSQSEPSLVHRVRRDPADGSLSCSCKGFRFRNECKHIARAVLDELGLDLEPMPDDREARVRALGPGWGA
ncbi:MAG: DUF3631 domain-containing protein, partial [Planctomycetota bacterium]